LVRFENPWFLLTLVGAILMALLFISIVRWKRATIKKIGDEKLIRQLINGYSARKFRFKFYLVLIAFVLTAMGVSNLQYPREVEQINRQGVDIMIALDVSKSMMAQDLQPNRLERAKQLASKLIDRLSNDRVGLVLFAGRAYLQMPLTTDHSAAKMYVNTASVNAVPTQGTVIGEALALCNNTFEPKQKKFKAVILITDGEDHDESALEIAKKMAADGVLLHTIGVGTTSGAQLTDPETNLVKRDNMGVPVVTRLNEKELIDLAQVGNGRYQMLMDSEAAVTNILKQVNEMEKRTITDNSLMNYRSFFQWFIAAAIVLLMLDLLISERKLEKS
jgi:Ca-activated chloride channel family protein